MPAAPSLELFRCSAPEEHRDMWNRILGPSEAFVEKPGVMKRFFPLRSPSFLQVAAFLGPDGRRQGMQFRSSLKLELNRQSLPAGLPLLSMKCILRRPR